MATALGRFLLGTLVLASAIGTDVRPPLPAAQPNPNLRPAGRIHKDTLRIALVVRMATWAPDLPQAPGTYRLTATPPGRPSVWRQVVMVR